MQSLQQSSSTTTKYISRSSSTGSTGNDENCGDTTKTSSTFDNTNHPKQVTNDSTSSPSIIKSKHSISEAWKARAQEVAEQKQQKQQQQVVLTNDKKNSFSKTNNVSKNNEQQQQQHVYQPHSSEFGSSTFHTNAAHTATRTSTDDNKTKNVLVAEQPKRSATNIRKHRTTVRDNNSKPSGNALTGRGGQQNFTTTTLQHPICRAWQQLSQSIFFGCGNTWRASIQPQTQQQKVPKRKNSPKNKDVKVDLVDRSSTSSTKATTDTSSSSKSGKSRLAARLAARQRASAVAAQVELLEQFSYLISSLPPSASSLDGEHLNHQQHHSSLESPYRVDHVLPAAGDVSNNTTKGGGTTTATAMVTIAPSGYDLETTLSEIAKHHSRAFLLLDLAHIVSAHQTFISYTAPKTSGGVFFINARHRTLKEMRIKVNERIYYKQLPQNTIPSNMEHYDAPQHHQRGVLLEPQFCVSNNRDLELLRLLIRLQVGLRCQCIDDIVAVRQAYALEEEKMNRQTSTEEGNVDLRSSLSSSSSLPLMQDDPSRTRQPNGYLHALWYNRHDHCDAALMEIAIDGPDEIHRIVTLWKRFYQRELNKTTKKRATQQQEQDNCVFSSMSQDSTEDSNLVVSDDHEKGSIDTTEATTSHEEINFTLRLPPLFSKTDKGASSTATTSATWMNLVESSLNACQQYSKSNNGNGDVLTVSCCISGISIDLKECCPSSVVGKNDVSKWRQEMNDLGNAIREVMKQILLVNSSKENNEFRVDVTGLPYPLTSKRASILTSMLANYVTRPFDWSGEEEKEKEHRTRSRPLIILTADVSQHLVAHAGALCCKIIGVKKQQQELSTKEQQKTTKDDTSKEDKNNSTVHYYIDDGCYGSLSCNSSATSTYSGAILPKVLRGRSPMRHQDKQKTKEEDVPDQCLKSRSSDGSSNSTDTTTTKAIVWGPTCDGLDKVCDSIMLPSNLRANDNDWLVFPQMGCGGGSSSTAFNGFDGPNTAYCVLGYFAGSNHAFGE